jgi:metal-responsive CopG/Arc/MetJ family transcriptional regulator
MRATLNIPDELIAEVQNITGAKSRTKAVVTAVQEFIRKKRMEELLALKGRIEIDYDWKREEKAELETQKKREKHLEK